MQQKCRAAWWAKARSVIVEKAQLVTRLCPPYEFSILFV